ncbi:HD domain-containing protein [Sphingomonas lutea]|uniref:HD domain-containing protein n=1 Tax=Sphingomonas lutea TaxID=1045317 RepID=A0A7G9SKI1_9SPHN|nr:HD-GYP domain-containing protein [Sphingomonas lutea]QNN68356.1 HD domain-containing protein [Sphingomonas lutea]
MLHQVILPPSTATAVTRAEIVAAFSYALDITEGQPAGHCIRACWIGFQVGRELGLSDAELNDLYYTLLLKDLGCSSNAARICELYEADDRAFKQGYKTVGNSLAATLHFVFAKTAQGRPALRRAAAIGNILKNGDAIAQELIVARCTRGADIARSLRFSDAICDGIYRLDEHWDGSGRPGRLRGDAIPLAARIALLAQVVDVFHTHAGRAAAMDEATRRSGNWFDPELVVALHRVANRDGFWATLRSPVIEQRVVRLAPEAEAISVDDAYLDAIAAAFGQVIDAKSPFTSGHSGRVADLTDAIAAKMGMLGPRRAWLRRAAFLHDIGKLGVSNAILDKPAGLNSDEWVEMRAHAAHTRAILGRIGVFVDLADVAAAHHERLDGCGYPLGIGEAQISRETRIITVCDFYDALTADRPYRSALPVEEALRIMQQEVGRAIDPQCFEALRAIAES